MHMDGFSLYAACIMALYELNHTLREYQNNSPKFIKAVNELTAEGCPPETLKTFCEFIVYHKPGDGYVEIHRKQLWAVLRFAVAALESLIADCDDGESSAISLVKTCIETGWDPREVLAICQDTLTAIHGWDERIKIMPMPGVTNAGEQ
jgi:hypothetical protein